ncbi:hypothetical protein C6P98_09380 [Burkholderia multivorans]|uniref:Uncharacterized protein n=1 Tax=Burkholderia multivorans TaxID=87883 RepID=A0A8E2RX90_9BURK|nr:hypothetical protein C6P76_15060 [Burkholderia multivorans]PRF25155.1 hypothetical protein C6P98_09380 [Burkholderia multivorans]
MCNASTPASSTRPQWRRARARVRAGRSGWRGSSMRGVPMHERLPAAVASRPICQSFAVFL